MRRLATTVIALILLPCAALKADASSSTASDPPTVPGASNCPIFPANNVWNRDIAALPVAINSASLIRSIGLDVGLHPDFGSFAGYGIPYNVVGGTQKKVRVSFDYV